MSTNLRFEDDDLALYALGLLAQPEAAAVARAASDDTQTRDRLALVQAQLAAYAEAATDQSAVPEGSLDRLMGQISRESRTAVGPRLVPATSTVTEPLSSPPARSFVPWLGWAVAAGLAFTAGTLFFERSNQASVVSHQAGEVAQLSSETAILRQQREAAQASADQQHTQLQSLAQQQADAQRRIGTEASKAGELRSAAAQKSAELSQQAATLTVLNAQLSDSTAQRQSLQHTVDAQSSQLTSQASEVSRLQTETAQAREITDTLTDRSALRVTLVKPRSKPEPTVRTTYLASNGTLVFQGSYLDTLAENKVYELWLLPADGSSPIPAGTFSPDAQGNASLTLTRLARAVAPKAFAVTIENQGGAQAPTMPIILLGAASS